MITLIEKSRLFNNLTDNSVIVHLVTCTGKITSNIAYNINSKFPKWFTDYHGYCSWFQKHEREILGTFHVFNASKNLIVCSAFASLGTSYEKQKIDIDVLIKVLKKIEHQTRNVNKIQNKNWVIHIPYNITTIELYDDNDEKHIVQDYIDIIFKDSPVEVQIHKS